MGVFVYINMGALEADKETISYRSSVQFNGEEASLAGELEPTRG